MEAAARSRARSGFEGFVELYRAQYGMYARARLQDAGPAAEVVAWTFGYVEAGWDAVLGCPEPTAVCWALLRGAVSRRTEVGRPAGDWLHETLPAAAADAVLLRYRLGLDLPAAARLMGVSAGVVEVELRAALRILART
ncbi:sigma factor-like helix-turn-helix DNA-binding protein [Kitasatospora sp. NPDC036755]|uniref:sigma factor-like helix-turn-helix DNA-binding protein n=1 Tax=Kitasatospora sp. NPDC036755 TaxID=3154600 RepID=UPI003404830C